MEYILNTNILLTAQIVVKIWIANTNNLTTVSKIPG